MIAFAKFGKFDHPCPVVPSPNFPSLYLMPLYHSPYFLFHFTGFARPTM